MNKDGDVLSDVKRKFNLELELILSCSKIKFAMAVERWPLESFLFSEN